MTITTTKPPETVEKGTDDILKTYISNSDISKRYFMPSVAYMVGEEIRDTLFESFIFLPSPNFLYDWGSANGGMKALDKADWQKYISDIQFAEDMNVDALDAAVGDVKAALGKSGYKAKIYLSLFYPVKGVTSFGEVNGKNLNLSNEADRIEAVKWMVDEHLRQFKARNYQNIEVAGFYWFKEEIVVSDDKELLNAVTDYVRSLGYITIWSGYYQAKGYDRWQELGIDKAFMQANYFPGAPDLPNNGSISRLASTASIAKHRGLGVELELANKTEASVTGFKQYLKSGVETGFMNGNHVYYLTNGPAEVYYLYNSRDAYIQETYTNLYQFINKNLKVSDITIQ